MECQRRGDIVAVLLLLEFAALDFMGAHASTKVYAAKGTKELGELQR